MSPKKTRAARHRPSGSSPRKAVRSRAATRRDLRLSTEVVPEHYRLALELDPREGDAYGGTVTVTLRIAAPVRAFELHAVDLDLGSVTLEQGGSVHTPRRKADPARETVVLSFPQPLEEGAAVLHGEFTGKLRGDLCGLYSAASPAGEGEPHRYAFTQLEPTAARRFFPCFDEPSFKAPLELSVTTAADHAVVSNAPVFRSRSLEDGRRTVTFRPTPPLSSYLYALAVGPLESSSPVRHGPVEIRVLHAPGKGKLTRFALEAARQCLARLEGYFDLPYPYEKLDLVAVPDFEMGAMENAGAVFFRETLLLLDPDEASLLEQKRAAEVIAHELSHMWYGDLVTMSWWNDLWLNEAFATWMAFAVVNDWKPEWNMWQNFQHDRARALELDALVHTHPVYAEVDSPEEATQNFDAITYEKGAAIVRMLEGYLGATTFREGVRQYLRRHAGGNATAADLWKALEEASGVEVERVVRAWIEQPGFPLLHLERTSSKRATVLRLSQERFLAAFSAGGKPATKPSRWPIPWVARLGSPGANGTEIHRVLFDTARARVELPGNSLDFVFGNADSSGVFRTLHAPEELAALARARTRLSPVERMTLIGDQWAAVRAGYCGIESYLDLLEAFGAEEDADTLELLAGQLGFLADAVVPFAGPGCERDFQRFVLDVFARQLLRLGLAGGVHQPDGERLRRRILIALLGQVAEWQPLRAEAAEQFQAYLVERSRVDANLVDAYVQMAAQDADAACYAQIEQAYADAATPQERHRFLYALAACRDPELIDRTLARTLAASVPTQDVVPMLSRALLNRHATERTWAFLKKRWNALRKRMTPSLVDRLIAATPALRTRAYRQDVLRFFRQHPVPTATRALKQAMERFDLNESFRKRAGPALRRWLAKRAPGTRK